VGMLGPTRMPYRKLFGTLRLCAEKLSENLSKSLGTFKINYRQPETGKLYIEQKEKRLLENE